MYFELLTPLQRLRLLAHADLLVPDALKFHEYDLWFRMVEQGMPSGAPDSPGRLLFAALLERVQHVVTPELAYFARDKVGVWPAWKGPPPPHPGTPTHPPTHPPTPAPALAYFGTLRATRTGGRRWMWPPSL